MAAARRERLLGVAFGLFNRRGVGATRVDEIAAEVGLNKRAIFRQFGSKDQLVAACFERANAIYLRIAEHAGRRHASKVEALHEAIRHVVCSMGDPAAPALTSHVGLGRLAHGTQMAMQDRFATLERAYRDMLRQGMAEGSIRAIPVNDVVAALAGSLNWVASTPMPYGGLSLIGSRPNWPIWRFSASLADPAPRWRGDRRASGPVAAGAALA